MIDAELAIKYLDELKEKYTDGEGFDRHPLPEYYAIEDGIEALHKVLEQEPKWIPVIDRLPDMGKYVLCSVNKIYVHESDLEVVISQFHNEGWWTDGRIKAWMPLPEPYKEGATNEKDTDTV